MAHHKDKDDSHTQLCREILANNCDKEAIEHINLGKHDFVLTQQHRRHRVTYDDDCCYVFFMFPQTQRH